MGVLACGVDRVIHAFIRCYGHDEAAQSAAILTTLIASAQRHGIDPQAYLTGVLARIASMPVSQLEKLLPDAWTK